jgi:predicted phosphodiesterase
VLADVSRRGLERVLVGGDVVDGPLPGETLELLPQLEPPPIFVRGNTERAVVVAGRRAFQGPPGELEDARPTALQAWVASRLSAGQLSYLAGLPRCWSTQIGGRSGAVLPCHTAERSRDLHPSEQPVQVGRHLAGVVADVVVCGHTHLQFELRVGGLRVINAGSVGCRWASRRPSGRWSTSPSACFEPDYDLGQAATTIKASGYPAATDFIRQHLQHPPPMAESVAYFERRAAADPSGGVEPAGWPP